MTYNPQSYDEMRAVNDGFVAKLFHFWWTDTDSSPRPPGLPQDATLLVEPSSPPVSDARVRELCGEPLATDPMQHLHRKMKRTRKPYIPCAYLDRSTLRRMRRVAAKELESLA